MADFREEARAALAVVPDDVILTVATLDIDLASPFGCLCGQMARVVVAKDREQSVEQVKDDYYVIGELVDRYDHQIGFTQINGAFANPAESHILEELFMLRVLVAVGN